MMATSAGSTPGLPTRGGGRQEDAFSMELSQIIGVDAVRAPLKATSKKRLLQDLADMAESVYRLDPAAVYKALLDREALGPTGVGRGVAIPHARLAGVPQVVGLFGRLEKAVDF